ncbi:MAG: hypothetical protein ACK4SA_17400 [Caldilinea sp.]
MRFHSRFVLLASAIMVVTASFALTACQPVRPLTEVTPAPVDAPFLSVEEQAIADAALQFVAGQLGVESEALHIQSVKAVQWPDASLGCPQPDMVYAAVITPGYLVTVERTGELYAVHTDSSIDGVKTICTQK